MKIGVNKNHLINAGIVIFLTVLMGTYSVFTYAQTETPTPTVSNDAISEKQKQIQELESKLKEVQGQSKTLSSQISVMNNQIKLTELRVSTTEQEISEVNSDIDKTSQRITKLESSLNSIVKVLLNRMVATYQLGSLQPLGILLATDNISDAFSRLNYLKIVQLHDKKLIYETQQAKNDYANQKQIFEDKKEKIVKLQAQLLSFTKQLDNEKAAKQSLLAITKNDEKKYQDLLAKSRAEYAAIQGIISGGGAETDAGSVTEGQRIASIIPSASCNSSGGHLHFIVSKNGATENPFNYLKGIESNNCSGSSCGSGDGDSFNPSGSWNWPMSGPIEMSQGYGSTWATRNTWVSQIYNFHNGLDIKGSSLEVKAVQSGTLYRGSYAGYNCRLPYVRLRHNDGIDTFYLHVYY